MNDSERKAPGLRQTMSDLHIWTGILAGWLLYAMFLTGTVSYFRDEISQWMRPELPQQQQLPDLAAVTERMAATLAERAPDSPQWTITLPTQRSNVAGAFWRDPNAGRFGFRSGTFDPASGAELSSRQTLGGDFFYRFHFQFHYISVRWGRWLAGLCAMFMLVAIVSGVITHKKIFSDFFTFRPRKSQRSWLDAHVGLSVLALPFHFMITYSGLVLFMSMYMPWTEQAAFAEGGRRQMSEQTSVFLPPGEAAGEPAPQASIAQMVRYAQQRWGADNISQVIISHPGDAAARVEVVRGNVGRVAMSPQYLLFDGVSGEVVDSRDSVGPAAESFGALYGLHMGRFADVFLRWLYFLVSLGGSAMVATGLVLWTVKRRSRLKDPAQAGVGLRLVERMNVSAIAGLSAAMAAFLWANRLLPVGLAGRDQWEIHVFFMVWGAALLHAFLRPAQRAWVEQLWVAAGLLVALPLLNAFTTSRSLRHSLLTGDWVFAGLELTLIALGIVHAVLAMRTARHRPQVRSRRPRSAETVPSTTDSSTICA